MGRKVWELTYTSQYVIMHVLIIGQNAQQHLQQLELDLDRLIGDRAEGLQDVWQKSLKSQHLTIIMASGLHGTQKVKARTHRRYPF
jgi:hypothetical protein